MKPSLAVILSFFLICGLTACSGNSDFNYRKNSETGEITITKYKGRSGEVTIPDTINGKPVTGIGKNAFEHQAVITSITIPDSVKNIGDAAFSDCDSLVSVVVPGSVEKISDYAFAGCDVLRSVVIQDGVTAIGNGAFSHCSALEDVSIPGSVKSVGRRAFVMCVALTSVTIAEGVETIDDDAFDDCEALTSVTIPNSITHVERNAFGGCPNLTATYKGKEYSAYKGGGYVIQNNGTVGYYVDKNGAKLGGAVDLPIDFYLDINGKPWE